MDLAAIVEHDLAPSELTALDRMHRGLVVGYPPFARTSARRDFTTFFTSPTGSRSS